MTAVCQAKGCAEFLRAPAIEEYCSPIGGNWVAICADCSELFHALDEKSKEVYRSFGDERQHRESFRPLKD